MPRGNGHLPREVVEERHPSHAHRDGAEDGQVEEGQRAEKVRDELAQGRLVDGPGFGSCDLGAELYDMRDLAGGAGACRKDA